MNKINYDRSSIYCTVKGPHGGLRGPMHLHSLHLAPVFWFEQQKLVLVKVRKIHFLSQNIGITSIKVRERQYDLIQFDKKKSWDINFPF